ncbi:MAG TPA: ribosome-associated translation inhibitor RaiA [Luteibacter sp.]|jgi:putative sigma-54 modulation protein|nr:ribosome-associated translation inhibitor RaiA [Luteibacter sp.]
MQVQLSGQHIEITPALREHVQSRLDRLERLYDNITSLAVVLSVEKLEQRADGTLAVAGNTFHAQAVDADMYTSIDILVEKLVVQLRKHKEKHCDHHAREGREINYG